MELLKEYYELKFDDLGPWEDAPEDFKKHLSETFGFALFKAARAFDDLKQEIKKSLCLN